VGRASPTVRTNRSDLFRGQGEERTRGSCKIRRLKTGGRFARDETPEGPRLSA